MGMVIRSNQMALNTNNALSNASKSLGTSMEKLATGFKINKAADDASGLSISEKMKAQIKALDTASANCEDGANLIQTAEGYMSETHEMLNRMVELSEKSANGVLDDKDRDALQDEMDQLCAEVDRIATTANFNGKKLMDGSLGADTAIRLTSTAGKAVEYDYDQVTANGIKLQIGESSTTADKMDVSINSFHSDALFSCVNGFVNKSNDTTDITSTAKGGTRSNYRNQTGDASAEKTTLDAAIATSSSAETAYKTTAVANNGNISHKQFLAEIAAAGITATNSGQFQAADVTTTNASKLTALNDALGTTITSDNFVTYANASLTAKKAYTDAAAATATAQIAYDEKVAETAKGYSTYKSAISVDITDKDKASAAADALRQISNYVSDERGKLGAQQNRLEYTVNNLTTASENTSAANSRIRDTDMAKQMTEYTKTNVIAQAAQAMLAQANSQPQSVLQLLQ